MAKAYLVYDGENFTLPADSCRPRADQLQGSPADQITEYAGRLCYDSLNAPRARNSADYHAHVREVNHSSVWGHANWTFLARADSQQALAACAIALATRPGVTVLDGQGCEARFTINLRAVRQWNRWRPLRMAGVQEASGAIGKYLESVAKTLCPLACCDREGDPGRAESMLRSAGLRITAVRPALDEEIWASFHVKGSRGMSHELVRHGFRTGISQRSTRFVDESDSPWCPHPMLGEDDRANLEAVREHACKVYIETVERVQARLEAQGADKLSARKSARGAARGALGNALETQLVFSASVAEWKWIARERMSKFADPEIRAVISEVYPLLSARFRTQFAGWETEPAPDGVGLVVAKFGTDEEEKGWLSR